MEAMLDELHHRIQKIRKEPGNNEGQQDTAQIVNQKQYGKNQQADAHLTHHLVNRYCLFFHFLL